MIVFYEWFIERGIWQFFGFEAGGRTQCVADSGSGEMKCQFVLTESVGSWHHSAALASNNNSKQLGEMDEKYEWI